MNIPKKVSIIVKRGEYLEYVVAGSKKSSKTRRWRVVFLGGPNKLASEYVDEQDGCPVWNCEVTLDLVSPSEPLSMLVLDGENRHVGQVVIPLHQIPQTGCPNFDMSKLFYSDLEPTRKNSNPHGRLVYWIWAEEYWPPGTKAVNLKHHKSLKGSLSHLGKGLRSKSKQKIDPNLLAESQHPDQFSNNIQYRNTSLSVNNLKSNPAPASTLGIPGTSYNPFEDDGSNIDFRHSNDMSNLGNPLGLPPTNQSNVNSPYAQSEYAASVVSKSGKHRNLVKRFKSKLSKSTMNLAEAAAKKAAGKDPFYQRPTSSQISLDRSSVRDSASHLDVSPTNQIYNQSTNNFVPNTPSSNENTTKYGGDDTGFTTPVQTRTDGVGEVAPNPFESPGSARGSTWGLHAEERPTKSIDEMSKREAAEYVTQLQKSLQTTRSELSRLQIEHERLVSQVNITEEELNDVRLTLASLRNRLLEDNLTQYLELPTVENGSLLGGIGSGRLNSAPNSIFASDLDGGFFESSHMQNGQTEPQSFLAKISALGLNSRKLGGFSSLDNNNNGNGNNANNNTRSNNQPPVASGWW